VQVLLLQLNAKFNKLGFETSITDFVKVAKYNMQHFFLWKRI